MLKVKLVIAIVFFISCQKSFCENISHKYLDYFQDVYLHTNLTGVSEKCSRIFRGGNFTQTTYFDASAKLPEGIGNGNFFDLGNFDQCYNHVEALNDEVHHGKYCLGYMGIGPSTDFPPNQLNFKKNDTFGMYTGFCLSNHCTLEDFSKIFYRHNFDETQCYSKDREKTISVGGWITIFIIIVIATIIICSTVYDLALTHHGKEPIHPTLLIFSAVRNGKKILATSNNPQQILCLNGIRTLSMAWIVCHHEFLILISGPIGNYYDIAKFFYTPSMLFLHQTSLSVDSFLTLAGILTAYTLMRRKNINITENYVHRYFRLTPILAMMVLITATLYTNMGEGPLWGNTYEQNDACKGYWWMFLLYIQNYNPSVGCLPQTWYLGVDMQCYIFAVVIMVFLKKWKKATLASMGLLIFCSAIAAFQNSYVLTLPPVTIGSTAQRQIFLKYYYKPTHTRCGPYLIGMICGYIIYNIKSSSSEHKLSLIQKVFYWIITLALLALCVFLPASLSEETVWQTALFNAVHRSVWSACVCSIILMCVTNNADFVNNFLSSPIFQVVARLSYCVYLVHSQWIFTKVLSAKTVTNFSITKVIVDSWGTVAASLLISFFFSLMFEMPAPEVEKYLTKLVKKIFCAMSSAVGIKPKPPKS